MAIFSTTANILTITGTIISWSVSGADALKGLLEEGDDFAALGADLTALIQSRFTDETSRDLAEAMTASQFAMSNLLDHPHLSAERKEAIITQASQGLAAVRLQAGVIVSGDSEPAEIEAAVGALVFALGVQLQVATVLQSGDMDEGGHRRPSIQHEISEALDVLNQARGAFVESLDINVGFAQPALSTVVNMNFFTWFLNWFATRPSNPTTFFDLKATTSAGIDVEPVLRDFFGGALVETASGGFRVPTNASATIRHADGSTETISLGSADGRAQVADQIEAAITRAALAQSGLGAAAQTLNAVVDAFGALLGGAFEIDESDTGSAMQGTAFDDFLDGGVGDDLIYGGVGADVLLGGDGNDMLHGGHGDDRVYGGDGNDVLYGGWDRDALFGGAGDDSLVGQTGADAMAGGTGNDTYFVSDFGDTVVEKTAEGVDHVVTTVNATLAANVENLTLSGDQAINGAGNGLNNRIVGNTASNILLGGDGDDTLDGRGGADQHLGGAGADTFVFGDLASADIIWDFTPGVDTLQLHRSVFRALAAGVGADNIKSGAATDANDHIILRDGGLYYDADGWGALQATKFAELGASWMAQRPVPTAGDFEIV